MSWNALSSCVLAALLLVVGGSVSGQAAPVWERAHAHNDYEHPRPLLDALDQGFCSVEADIWLVGGELLVAHDLEQAKPGRTLEKLYWEPLRERVQRHGGRVHPDGPTFTLLIDVKSEAEAAYRVLRTQLAAHATFLTRFSANETVPGAVTVILSGNRPTATVAAEASRWCAIDGRLDDLTAVPPPSVHLMPLVSQSWTPTFSWFEDGVLPETDRAALRRWVAVAHRQGRRLRFWGVPDQPFAWKELYAAGVDLINTDNLKGLNAFLQQASTEKP